MRLNQLTKPARNIRFRNVVNGALARSKTDAGFALAACTQAFTAAALPQDVAIA
jgi:hypothetical protein